MAKQRKDIFINRAIQRLTMTGVNVLSFQQLNFAVGVFQGVALVIHRIIYHIGLQAWRETQSDADSFIVALTVSQNINDLNMTNIEIIDRHEYTGVVVGAVVSLLHAKIEVVSDFATLPEGGIIIPANPVFLGMSSAGLTTAGVIDAEIYFTFRELGDADYIELIQSRVQANV
ncbi:hypothetical protein LCGC14_2753800 [marine sediment metagenome]|uniref:Uncharacterized protein n=1 Tax=marine sediment metagenome TaxID=412755 RepID=A0A0F8Z107_9ZZZZ